MRSLSQDFSDSGDNGNFGKPVYHDFIDASYTVANKVELIHPARFLFNAGSTPKAWNKKMLNDPHLKVMFFTQDISSVFPNTDIMGGIAITYHDENKNFGAIETFTAFQELNSIIRKVEQRDDFLSISSVVFSAYSYHFTDFLHRDYPNIRYKEKDGKNSGILSKGHDYDLKSNVIEKLPDIFTETPNNEDSVKIVGLCKSKRVYRYISEKYISGPANFKNYKVFIPAANGSNPLGGKPTPLIGEPILGEPFCARTETFISVGNIQSETDAKALTKYIKNKFARCLLGVLKITQHVTPEKWKYVPLKDFTPSSDIDWSVSISAIDQQLYRKYGLNEGEITFIETNVKEMV